MARVIKGGSKSFDFSSYIGYFISTLLLFLFRGNNTTDEVEQKPSKFTQNNGNTIGSAIPAVLGRAMIHNPLVSFYGAAESRIYTEEYGMHSALDVWGFLFPAMTTLIMAVSQKDTVRFVQGKGIETPAVIPPGGDISGTQAKKLAEASDKAKQKSTNNKLNVVAGQFANIALEAGPYTVQGTVQTTNYAVEGTVEYAESGAKRSAIVSFIASLLLWLLLNLFNQHAGRTTIQKGFLYYLGWQHIICWTGENIGLKKIWMNVYDSDVEDSTQQGVWDNNSNVAWRKDNPAGITANVDNDQMFGGWDEGGGFIGDIRVYLGGYAQPKDPWMIKEMTVSQNMPQNLLGLTPRYPMFVTCVVSDPDLDHGAYIGKQATVPEMWFEIVNYPDWLQHNTHTYRLRKFEQRLKEADNKLNNFLLQQQPQVQTFMQPYFQLIQNHVDTWIDESVNSTVPATVTLNDIINDMANARTVYPSSEVDLYDAAKEDLEYLCGHGVWQLGRLEDDLNPAEAIYEILTNTNWGCHYEKERIDIESLVDLGITCEDEKLGISCLINEMSQAREFINKIMSHINAVHFDNPTTGKLTFKCIRNDFDPYKIPVFDTTNCQDLEFTRVDWSEVTSIISARFTDPDSKYNTSEVMVNDLANRIITKSYTSTSIDASYFTTARNARIMAQTQLLSAGYPLSAISMNCNRSAYNLLVGDPILVSWEPFGIQQQIYRVTNIDYATLTEGMIKVTAIEDVFSFDLTEYIFSGAPSWTEPDDEPLEITRELFMEMPFELTYSLDTYVVAFAARPSNYTIYWDVWRFMNGQYQNTAKTMRWSMVGKMTYGYEEGYDIDANGVEFGILGVDSMYDFDTKIAQINSNTYTYTNKSPLNLVVVDDEIMSYDRLVKLPNGNYKIEGVIRGVYDTIPKKHTAESIMFFLDYYLDVNGQQPVALVSQYAHEELELTTETQTAAQPFDINKIEVFDTKRRSEQPSVMANLKMSPDRGDEIRYDYYLQQGQAFSYDILFQFNPRNKFNLTGIIAQTDSTTPIGVSADTKIYVRTSCNGNDFELKWDATKGQSYANLTMVCTGDSLTFATGGWTWLTTAQTNYSALGMRLIDDGHSPYTIGDAMNNFNNNVLSNTPTANLIWVGADDVWVGNTNNMLAAKNRYEQILDMCIDNNILPIVCLYTPTFNQVQTMVQQGWGVNTPQVAYQLFQDLYSYCSTLAFKKGVPMIKPLEAIKDPTTGAVDPTMVIGDQYHFTRLGAQTVGDYIFNATRQLFEDNNISKFRYKWAKFCEMMGNDVSMVGTVELEIGTYSETDDLYSYDAYHKTIEYAMPQLAGIVDSALSVQAYADSLVRSNLVVLPAGPVSPQYSLAYTDCPLIFVGTLSPTQTTGIKGQDGQFYDIGDEAYRIDGIDSNGQAILHQVEIEDYFIFKTYYTEFVNNYPECWKYLNYTWDSYTPLLITP